LCRKENPQSASVSMTQYDDLMQRKRTIMR
jgi:hypothetical protein